MNRYQQIKKDLEDFTGDLSSEEDMDKYRSLKADKQEVLLNVLREIYDFKSLDCEVFQIHKEALKDMIDALERSVSQI